MTCTTRDQDLLLLAHGALSLPCRLRTQRHLRRCASCRERYRQLQNVSYAFAGGVRGPNANRWSPALNNIATGLASGSRLSHLRLTILLAFVTVVTIITLYLVVNVTMSRGHNAARPPASPSQGCAPGLPNDQCR